MKTNILILFFLLTLIACSKQEKTDLIITNANVYTVNDDFAKAEAFAVKDGKIIAVGSADEIQKAYIVKGVSDSDLKKNKTLNKNDLELRKISITIIEWAKRNGKSL